MKKHINLIVALMTLCVVVIVGLQLFWNYQNYTATVKTFNREINEGLTAAVEEEISSRHRQMIAEFKKLLADTSFITITCDTKTRDSSTVFHITDRYPKYPDAKSISFGLRDFKEKLNKITPEAKQILIDHFAENILLGALKSGVVYFYTPRLGDSVAKMYETYNLNLDTLSKYYRSTLLDRGIRTGFELNADTTRTFTTAAVNADLRRPDHKSMVRAGFEDPDVYFLKAMKWVIISTLLLIAITLFCFTYTVKTLLSQQKLAEMKNNFINNMTHELNTPLTSIKITTEALQSFEQNEETRKEYLQIIRHQTEKLSDMTARILETSRLTKSRENAWNTVDLGEIISSAIEDISPQYAKLRGTIRYNRPADACRIRGEEASLLNVFVNIFDNALKYTTQTPVVAVTFLQQKGFAEILIADNGIGIDHSFRAKIFDQFFRIPHGNLHDVKGYGLGLSYVKEVVSQHHGDVSVNDNITGGSVFKIRLPLL